MGEWAYVLSVIGVEFGVLYYKQFLDKRCGIGNSCWLYDDYV
jgi:hypothetical protein